MAGLGGLGASHDPYDRGGGRGGGGLTYAQKVGKHIGYGKNRLKLNVLDAILERKNKEINLAFSKEELSKLIFKKMNLTAKQVLKVPQHMERFILNLLVTLNLKTTLIFLHLRSGMV